MSCCFTCVVVTYFRFFFVGSRAKHPEAEMIDDYLGSATVAHKLAPHQPRDRHTENVKKVIIVDCYLMECVRRSELDVS